MADNLPPEGCPKSCGIRNCGLANDRIRFSLWNAIFSHLLSLFSSLNASRLRSGRNDEAGNERQVPDVGRTL